MKLLAAKNNRKPQPKQAGRMKFRGPAVSLLTTKPYGHKSILLVLVTVLAAVGILIVFRSLAATGGVASYVRMNGSDSNACTSAQPCRTIARGVANLYALAPQTGGRVIVGSGTYSGTAGISSSSALCFYASRDGAFPDNSGIFAEDNSNPPVLQAVSGGPSDCAFMMFNAVQNITLSNIILDGNAASNPEQGTSHVICRSPNLGTSCGLLTVRGTSNGIMLDHVTLRNSHHQCSLFASDTVGGDGIGHINGLTIKNSYIHHCGSQNMDDNLVHGVYLKDVDNFLIEDSEIAFTTSIGIQLYNSTSTTQVTTPTIIRRNWIHDTGIGRGGIAIVDGYTDVLFENNLFTGNGHGIIAYATTPQLVMRHNTFRDNNRLGLGGVNQNVCYIDVYGGGGVFTNNICSGSTAVQRTVATANFSGSNNILTGALIGGGNFSGLIGTITANPSYFSATDSRLVPGSPGIDAASASATIDDLNGKTRPGGTSNDIGAYEYGAVPGSTLTPSPVPTPTPATPPALSPEALCPNGTRIEAEAMTAGGAAIPIVSGYRDWSTLVSYLDFTYGPPALGDYTLKMRYWAPGTATRQVYRRIPGSASTATITNLASSTASWSTQSVVLTAWQPLSNPSLNVSLSANTTSDGKIALDYVDICPPEAVITPTPTPVPTASCTKAGDTNCDGKVNSIDLQAILSNYGKRTTLRSQGDLTGDGVVNIFDLSQVLQNWGR